MQDIIERLDAELGRAPEPTFEIAATVVSGRRAVRRRRLAAGAAALVVATVVGGTALATTGNDGARGKGGQIAHQPPASASPSASSTVTAPSGFRLERGELASYDPQGKVVVRDGWRITEQIENPLQRTAPARSIGLAITDGSETYWFLLDFDDKGMSAASDPAGKAFATLQEWVADQVDLQRSGESDQRPFVEFGAGGRLQARPGVEIVEQRTDVDLGERFAPPERTAVALLDVDGKRWFVSARRLSGSEPEYFPVDSPAAGTTLGAFISYARGQYAPNESGGSEGLR